MLARLAEAPLLVILLGVTGCLTLIPALHGLAMNQHDLARAFFYSALILLILTVMLGIATAAFSPRDPARSHLAALAVAFLLLPVAMILPMREALPDTTLVNAWFEMISSFTTTGASVYAPDRLSDTIHLWRATVGWYGGFLTLMAAYAILAPLNLGGVEVATGRVPGRGAAGTAQITRTAEPSERLTRIALQIFPIFSLLTFALWLGLLIAGETATTALIHAMGILSTSGISGQSGLASSDAGIPGEMLMFAFLLFAITRRAMPGLGPTRRNRLLDDPELRLAAVILSAVTAILFLRHWFIADAAGVADLGTRALASLWGIVFTAASFLTTTGYVSGEWQGAAQWSGIGTPGLILLGLAMIGGGTATTAGGVKLLRVYALLRHGERELERIIHPSSVGGGGGEVRRLRREGAQLAWVFFMLFAFTIAILVATLALLGVGFEPALVLAISALTTTGQLSELGAAAPIAFSALSDPVKLTLGLAMIVGRLETLALLALVLPVRGRS
ncbi:potassium transporter TrkG [Tabrizicola sp.]|uniref:potassium transporter TrkG n=1 Tax=Tabrizicola sp. TaxID=2005166 RepID=UPI00262ED57F|nr:potassium transporter TrkG [Tabrizicola sp.]MDM7930692.1 potassium transporter TrkG [Tabrizicola sp.]